MWPSCECPSSSPGMAAATWAANMVANPMWHRRTPRRQPTCGGGGGATWRGRSLGKGGRVRRMSAPTPVPMAVTIAGSACWSSHWTVSPSDLWPSSRVSWKIRAAHNAGIRIRCPWPSTLVCRSLFELRFGPSPYILLPPPPDAAATTCICCC
ncbi:Os01g0594400 [Oryza sativa Japonica Group]|uniref:Os01g0594400 protein n=1 Tax=Oryza sativa subsp. japonica TaxID=39947 RepID=A0A0P0V4S1_ORYSJ|nr:Os01g0594400 [Oryza sativa Japonica Group]